MNSVGGQTASGRLQWLTGRFVALGLGLQLLCCALSTIAMLFGLATLAVYFSPVAWAGGLALILACIFFGIKMLLDAKTLADYGWAVLWALAALSGVIPWIVLLTAWMLTPAGLLGLNSWFGKFI